MILQNKTWKPGDWIYINKLYWDQKEVDRITEVLETDWFAGNSKFNLEFERRLSGFIGLKYVQTVNSGSAAIELAVQSLIQSGRWRRGERIIHPSLTFPTSISSAIMAGMVPVFIDVKPGTYVIDADKMVELLELDPKIAGAIIPALLGNSPDMDKIKRALAGRPLILDSCDVLGTKWEDKELASLATLSTFSFYGSHHISTFGIGGAVATNDDELVKYIKSMTFWGRDFTDYNDPVKNFLTRYSYETFGLDAQMSAVQAAFGLAQLDKLAQYIGERKSLFTKLQRLFSQKLRYFILPERTNDKADVSWFCYPIVVRENAPFTRDELVDYLLNHKIEIRPIFCNILDQKMMVGKNKPDFLVHGEIKTTIEVQNRGLFIPACPMPEEQETHYLEILEQFLERY